MSERQSLSLTYTPLESGNEESRWIRLEQTQATLPGPPSLGGTAEMLDRVYGIDPCEEGLGGGGEAAGDDPSAEEVEESLAILLDDAGLCRQGHWLAAVNVYRTHEQPGYELRSETATVETVALVEESHQQVVDVDGPLIALERPYAGSLTGIPAGVGWTVRGGTVNLDRPVRDRLTLRYQTKYERVTLRVPTLRTDDGEEYEPAAVVAFWGDMAAECALEPPEPESDEDREARESICRKRRLEPSEPGGCWKTVRHYYRCECSNRQVEEWEEQVPAPCDGFRAGAFIGYEYSFDGYTDCGEREDVHDPEFYKQRCCEYPPTPLPRCREMRRVYRGGHEIESGPEHWKNIYGENVILRPVLPRGGVCGDEITRWNVPQKNCCEGVDPLEPWPDNPEHIEPGGSYMIYVTGGTGGELTWQATGGLRFDNGGATIKTPGRSVHVTADDSICPRPAVTVNDGCSTLRMEFEGTASDPPTLPDDMALQPDTNFSVTVSGGAPGYMWTASGVTLLGWSADGATAYFRTGGRDEWCMATITVSDTCGRDASMTIMNAATGRWVGVTNPDPCELPCSPVAAVYFPDTNVNPVNVTTVPRCGHYAEVRVGSGRCASIGLEMVVGSSAHWRRHCSSWCVSDANKWCEYKDGRCLAHRRSDDVVYNQVEYTNTVTRLWRWVCQ